MHGKQNPSDPRTMGGAPRALRTIERGLFSFWLKNSSLGDLKNLEVRNLSLRGLSVRGDKGTVCDAIVQFDCLFGLT
ncbi:MAG: hypothetical protein ABI995_06210, partial [Acidobacteriota bacterium]